MRYALARAWFWTVYRWHVITGRKHKTASRWLERAYNAQTRAGNRRVRP